MGTRKPQLRYVNEIDKLKQRDRVLKTGFEKGINKLTRDYTPLQYREGFPKDLFEKKVDEIKKAYFEFTPHRFAYEAWIPDNLRFNTEFRKLMDEVKPAEGEYPGEYIKRVIKLYENKQKLRADWENLEEKSPLDNWIDKWIKENETS